MTEEQYNKYGKPKKKFRCTKGEFTRYTLDISLDHLKTRFVNHTEWLLEEITEEEFLSNYTFQTKEEYESKKIYF